MAYTPTTWVDGSAPDIDAANLNHLENGVQAAAATADAAVPKSTVTTNGDLIVGTGVSTVSRLGVGAAGTVLKGGTSPAYAAVVNADIDAAAAIAVSKLASYPSDGTKFLAGDGTWKAAGSFAGGELDYAQITTNSAAVTATTEGTATAIITGNSITYSGVRVKVEFFAPKLTGNAAFTAFLVFLRDSTVLGQSVIQATSSAMTGVKAEVFDTPSAAAHVYKASLFVTGAVSLTVNAGAGGSGNLVPAFLRVTTA